MASRSHDLASLLHPLRMAEFFASYWECKPFVIHRGDAGYYQALLTNHDLEDIISTSDLRFPAIKLSKNGSFYPPHAYTSDVTLGRLTFNGVPDVNKICLEYGKGATISLPSLQRTWGPLAALCTRLEEVLDFTVHANAYITPGEASGFSPHYDTHEVLVLQIAGKKKWLIDEPPLKLPHSTQESKAAELIAGPRMMEIELVAGDALYLPRGYVHSTTTSDSHSAHITLGINVFTWADMARDFQPSCVEQEEFRRALPPGFASRPELRPAVKAQLMRLLPVSPIDHDVLIDHAIALVRSSRRRTPARFRADVSVITANSRLQVPTKQRYDVAQLRDQLVLNFDGRRFVFPAAKGGTLQAMCAQATFRVADLGVSPDTEGLLTFARALQNIGFLQVTHL
jgi:hypothetical protein